MIRQMQEHRSLIFEEKESKKQDNAKLNSQGSNKVLNQITNEYSLKDIIKEARNEKVMKIPPKQEKKINRKVQLEPIKK